MNIKQSYSDNINYNLNITLLLDDSSEKLQEKKHSS